MVVGISDYQDAAIPDLRFADRDAEAFANFLRSPAGGALDGDHLKVLTNDQATLGQIAAALDWLMEVAQEGDNAIIYFSGHGDVENKRLSQPGYLLGWDAPARNYMAGGAVNVRDFQDIVSTLSVTNKARVVVITDACHSGKLSGSEINGAQLTGQNLARQFANEVKILSCQPNEYSIEGEQWGGGRGAFSYHLVDALYGLADQNNDLFVTLQEAGRYLEDHVTAEVAPVSQVPMVLGNRTEQLASVDGKLLADLRAGRTSQMQMLSPVEMRGMEDEVLAGVDTTVRETYRLFKKALKDKVFLEPATACADAYYERLMAEPKMARLHSTMTRNYAAALQDDAQQVMNIMLKSGLTSEILSAAKAAHIYRNYPAHLDRAAELLGSGHYMYAALKARRHYFEGTLQTTRSEKKQQFFQALHWQADMPHAYTALINSYPAEQADSAEHYASKAMQIVPAWVKPYIYLSVFYEYAKQPVKAEELLNRASQVDSGSILVWYSKALFYHSQKNTMPPSIGI
ncbi:MAG: caspase family protein [Lewinellaceae bacterium]|nr:caspase family protein [Lewinellaceae bacterium]